MDRGVGQKKERRLLVLPFKTGPTERRKEEKGRGEKGKRCLSIYHIYRNVVVTIGEITGKDGRKEKESVLTR